jgi:hypothetical protein
MLEGTSGIKLCGMIYQTIATAQQPMSINVLYCPVHTYLSPLYTQYLGIWLPTPRQWVPNILQPRFANRTLSGLLHIHDRSASRQNCIRDSYFNKR